ncbi:MAG: hypothetical protein HC853_09075, partial [Anaerolineae bacterium]|nr:hypothetical protein [Anaerolineae bacterium]
MAVEQIFYCELRVCEMENWFANHALALNEYPSKMRALLQATTLDEVIAHLDAIIETAKREK